ncbi:MAG: DUF2156 domain-containing protein [Verrucomicrobiota bacterium]
MGSRIIAGQEAIELARETKWDLLSPFLKRYGTQSLAYATLQDGMEYFVHDTGYIAFNTVSHPVFARRPHRVVLSDPVCAPDNYAEIVRAFLESDAHASFAVVSEPCAEALRALGFKINCLGYEPELAIQTYNTKGNWQDLDLIKRARNEAKREGISIREESIERLDKTELTQISARWIRNKKVNDREIWIYARRPVLGHEPDVRKFVAFDKEGHVVGFAFYDPMYRDGSVFGYSSNISRCDEEKYGKLATAIHMTAIEAFRQEGKQVFNLLLAPFSKLDDGKYNDDLMVKLFFQVSERFGNNIYNFKGLSFHKSKYRGQEKSLYFASNRLMPSNDVYLAFRAADITKNYFSVLGRLMVGFVSTVFQKQPAAKTAKPAPSTPL